MMLLLLVVLIVLLLLQSASSIKPKPRWRRENDEDKLDLSNSVSSIIGNAKSSIMSFFGYAKDDNDAINLKEYLLKLEQETTIDYDKINNDMESAKTLINNKQYYEAVDKLLDVLEQAPFIQSANQLAGASLLALGLNQQAEGFLYVAVQISDWSDTVAISNLAEALIQSNDIDLAEKISYQGLTTLKNNNEADTTGLLSYSLGNINRIKQNFQSAADWYLSSALNNPNNVQAWLFASTTLFPYNAWDYKFAENVLVQALEYHRNNPDIVFKLGYILHTGNPSKVTEAITFYEEALTLKHDHNDALKSLATAYHSIGRLSEALRLYEKVLHHDDQDVTILSNYAILLTQSDNVNLKQRGRQLALKAASINPNNQDVIKALQSTSAVSSSSSEL